MKTCFKCDRELPLSEFYEHPAMKGGRLNKCKDCAKRDVKLRRIENPEKLSAYERKRNKNPERMIQIARHLKLHRAKWPEKNHARQAVNNALRSGKIQKKPCEFESCGELKVEAHHRNYSLPLEVQWYCHFHHRVIEGRLAAA